MILPKEPQPISVMASYVQKAYKMVEERTGVKFGEDWLWHIFNPDKSDWFPYSEKPAIALCVFSDFHHELAIPFGGRSPIMRCIARRQSIFAMTSPTSNSLEKYDIPETEFYSRLHSEVYKEKAYYELALVKQLQVTGFPTVLLRVSDSKFYLLSRGWTDYPGLSGRIDELLRETQNLQVK